MKYKFSLLLSLSLSVWIFLTGCVPAGIGSQVPSSSPYHDDIPVEKKAESDWLFLMYMDGDNDLQDLIFDNILQTEEALSVHKRNFPDTTITAVCLFDGVNATDLKKNNNKTVNYKNIEGSYLWELSTERTEKVNGPAEFLSQVSNLTYTAAFLSETYNELNKSSEVNMADYNTLKNFINWASKRYKADKVVLIMSDHGSGPYSVRERSDDSYKAVCEDFTSNAGPIGTNELSLAFDGSDIVGFEGKSGNKFDIIVFDSCLSGAVEEIYEVRKYADYVVASPQSVPSLGFPYNYTLPKSESSKGIATSKVRINSEEDAISIFANIDGDTTPEDFGREIVRCYANQYSSYYSNRTLTFGDNKRSDEIIDFDGINFYISPTLTLVKTESMDNLFTAVNSFAQYLTEMTVEIRNGVEYSVHKNRDSSDSKFRDQDGNEVPDLTGFPYSMYLYNKNYSYLFPRMLSTASGSNGTSSTQVLIGEVGDGDSKKITCLYYKGTHSMHVDLGYMMKSFIEEDNVNDELRALCKTVLDCLNDVIIVSWRRCPSDNDVYINDEKYKGEKVNTGLYPKLTSTSYSDITDCYGLTITGPSLGNFYDETRHFNQTAINSIGNTFKYLVSNRYRRWSEFGQFSEWKKFISN
ncbi:MAG: clostripain-related cysteine peptidase [Treponema sp.]|uniref:clostripain-related cysteine peptidase n=1 Tax=Treponema sp. TaxID=166 RepID=UPI00298E81B5|nr:clostripain-related cysteine peptidase [Treponema sp.]MCQ2600639.1 clostripain-related cysteine peptidase [Treponema sp.]